jgi:hypothetical protein
MDCRILHRGKKRQLPANPGCGERETKQRRHRAPSTQAMQPGLGPQELSQISASLSKTKSRAILQETSSLPTVLDLTIQDDILQTPSQPSQPSQPDEPYQQGSHENGILEDEMSNTSQAPRPVEITTAAAADVVMLDIGVAIQANLVNSINEAERDTPSEDAEVCFGLVSKESHELLCPVATDNASSSRWRPR